ncbi:MAG: hypothetical protein IT233_04100 [Bacteroidia bacterium]|nr:hypothetical protein [Bacteroidia bacterium]
MANWISRAISFILHPLLMPTYGAFFLLRHDLFISEELRGMILFYVFFFSFLLPVLNILFLWYRKAISSLYLHDRKERVLPYVATLVVYLVSWYMIRAQLPAPSLSAAMLGASMAVAVTLMANFFYKVSAHMVGIGGLTGAIFFLSISQGYATIPEMAGLFIAAGVLAGARLHQEAHSPFEIWTGYLLGWAPQVVFLFL